MNLSHVITEFSFGPHFPEMVQPLDNSFEVTHDRTSTIRGPLQNLMVYLQLSLHINISFMLSRQHTSPLVQSHCEPINTVLPIIHGC